MPYTPPAGNAADFHFAKTGAFVREGDDAKLTWYPGPEAMGWKTTRFGKPSLSSGFYVTAFGTATMRYVLPATGFTGTQVGDPKKVIPVYATSVDPATAFGTPFMPITAKGSATTAFGLPNSPYPQTGQVSGLLATTLGAPRLLTVRGATLAAIPSTVVSLAYTQHVQVLQGTGTRFGAVGTPRKGSAVVPPTSPFVGAEIGWSSTIIGTPKSPYAQSTVAAGFGNTRYGWPRAFPALKLTIFGTPVLARSQRASGFLVGALGVPALVRAASGFGSTAFGQATAKGKLLATGFAVVRAGTPAVFVFGHRVYSIRPTTNISRPFSTNRVNRRTTGWTSTQVPTPRALDRHHALHAAPTVAFGNATLMRNSAC